MVRASRWLLGALACLSACSASPRGSLPQAEAIAPPTAIDGRYSGIARLIRANGRGCPRSGRRVVTIEGNTLSVPYRGATVSYSLAATVGADGAVHGSDGRGTIEGQISGQHLDLTVSSDFCEVRYALERS